MKSILLILLLTNCWGAIASPNVKETYKDIIQKAQTLSLQQQRLQAAQVLQRALENETSKKAHTELLKTLQDLSTLFYTEKGQSVYEYGRSLFRSAPIEASEKFTEALKLEGDNVAVILQSARLNLLMGRCDDADVAATDGLKINPYEQDFFLIQAQARTCTQKQAEALLVLKKVPESVYAYVTRAQIAFLQKEYEEASSYIALAKAADPNFPEIYLWDMQIRKKEGEPFENQILKYTRACKAMTTKDYLRYEKEPRICSESKNLEAEFKSIIEAENKKEI